MDRKHACASTEIVTEHQQGARDWVGFQKQTEDPEPTELTH